MDFSSALLPLPWTVVHAMDERSPLHGATPASLAASDTEIIAILDGTDEVPEPNVIFFLVWAFASRIGCVAGLFGAVASEVVLHIQRCVVAMVSLIGW